MQKVIGTKKLPIKMWAEMVEPGVLNQAKRMAKQSYIRNYIALMANVSPGYGSPNGAVITTSDVVIPNAVGSDIGCGIMAVKTNIKTEEISGDSLYKISEEIIGNIKFTKSLTPGNALEIPYDKCPVAKFNLEKSLYYLSVLGNKGHFIEISKDDNNKIWVLVHSGSGILGPKIHWYYNEKSEKGFLSIKDEKGINYCQEVLYCCQYAAKNRSLIMGKLLQIISEIMPDTEFDKAIDAPHNYITTEKHGGEKVIVHRKGAICAYKNHRFVMAGGMGNKSYIVEGLGNEQSFTSCSNGTGRRMTRKEAVRDLLLSEEIIKLDEKKILHFIDNENDLEESPSVYKNIELIMGYQKDLIKIEEKLTPMAVFKGDPSK